MQISENLKWMKYLLFGYHDNRPVNKYILLIFAHFGLKTTTFSNAHKNYRYNDTTLNLSGLITLFILNLKNYFLGVGKPNFSGEQVENRAKIGKCSKFRDV